MPNQGIHVRLAVALAVLALGWLLIILVPALRQMSGLFLPALVSLGILLGGLGAVQVWVGLKATPLVLRRRVLMNGICAMGIPLGVLAHNLITALSGGRVEEAVFFLLGTLALPPAVVITSILVMRSATSGKIA